MVGTVNTSVAKTVSVLAHTLLRIPAIYPTVAIIFFVFIWLYVGFFYEALRGCLQNTHTHTFTHKHTHTHNLPCREKWFSRAVCGKRCVSWAHTDGARSGVVDEKVVSNVTGTPVHQTTQSKESTRGAEMVSKTRLSPSVQFLLSNLDPISEPSSLLLFFFQMLELGKQNMIFERYTFFPCFATGRHWWISHMFLKVNCTWFF